MEMMVPDLERENLPSPQIRNSSTEAKQKHDQRSLEYDNNRQRNGGTAFQITGRKERTDNEDETSRYDDGEEPIDFALSTTSPYLLNSVGAPQG